jgi:hypothetical protein
MAGLEDLKKRIIQIREAITAKLPDIAIEVTLSAKALAERHIKDKGFGKGYSDNKIPSWFLDGKELNQSGATWLANKKIKDSRGTHTQDGVKYYPADYGVNWKMFRSAQGLQTEHVDLTYSGKMFANMQPVRVEQIGEGRFIAWLGATNTEAKDKMNWNRDRFGDFITKALTDDDRELLVQVVEEEVLKVLNEFN